jgi:hypothetical protein
MLDIRTKISLKEHTARDADTLHQDSNNDDHVDATSAPSYDRRYLTHGIASAIISTFAGTRQNTRQSYIYRDYTELAEITVAEPLEHRVELSKFRPWKEMEMSRLAYSFSNTAAHDGRALTQYLQYSAHISSPSASWPTHLILRLMHFRRHVILSSLITAGLSLCMIPFYIAHASLFHQLHVTYSKKRRFTFTQSACYQLLSLRPPEERCSE